MNGTTERLLSPKKGSTLAMTIDNNSKANREFLQQHLFGPTDKNKKTNNGGGGDEEGGEGNEGSGIQPEGTVEQGRSLEEIVQQLKKENKGLRGEVKKLKGRNHQGMIKVLEDRAKKWKTLYFESTEMGGAKIDALRKELKDIRAKKPSSRRMSAKKKKGDNVPTAQKDTESTQQTQKQKQKQDDQAEEVTDTSEMATPMVQSYELENAKKQIRVLQKKLVRSEVELADAIAKLLKRQDQLAKSETGRKSLQEKLDSTQYQLSVFEKELEQTLESKKKAEETKTHVVNTSTEDKTSLLKRIEELESQLAESIQKGKDKLSQAEARASEAESKVLTMESKILELRTNLSSELTAKNKLVVKSEKDAMKFTKRENAFKDRLKERLLETKGLEKKLAVVQGKLEQTQSKMEEERNAQQRKQVEFFEAQSLDRLRIAALEDELDEATNQLIAAEADGLKKAERIQALEGELDKSQQEFESIRKKHDTQEHAQSELLESLQKHNSEVMTTLATREEEIKRFEKENAELRKSLEEGTTVDEKNNGNSNRGWMYSMGSKRS